MAKREEDRDPPVVDFAEMTTAEPMDLASLGRLRLLVFGNETFVTHPLPPMGTVTIGRADEANIRLDDPSISRIHATLHIGLSPDPAQSLLIQDLGSSNGTKVRGKLLEPNQPRAISAGEVIDVGQTMIIVQHSATAGRPRRFWTHGYFEMRLEEECARAKSSGNTFAVVRVRCTASDKNLVEEILTSELRPFDLIAAYAPDEYELLVVDTGTDRAQDLSTRLTGRLVSEGVDAKLSIAMYPEDGREPEALVERASTRVRGDSAKQTSDDRPVVVVQDSAMQQIYRMLERVAPSNISVLILGETGVGKEVLAEAVHQRSQRSGGQLLRLNCAALSESLLESELFGHERGAFSGAVGAKPGLLETADRGTVFLDEIGELTLATQVKLLRVIEERKVRRVGGLEQRSIDVRFISATNRDLEQEIQRGRFRMDLFYRLNGISVVIPPLRERVEEIDALTDAFVAHSVRNLGIRTAPRFSPEARALLHAYSWPGNIRELRNLVERSVLLAEADLIEPQHLPVEKMSISIHRAPSPEVTPIPPQRGASSIRRESDSPADLKGEIEELERRRIIEALDKCGGVQTKAAKMLGWSRGTFLSRLEAYNIPRRRKK